MHIPVHMREEIHTFSNLTLSHSMQFHSTFPISAHPISSHVSTSLFLSSTGETICVVSCTVSWDADCIVLYRVLYDDAETERQSGTLR